MSFAPSKGAAVKVADMRANLDTVRQLSSRVSQFSGAGVMDAAAMTEVVAPLCLLVRYVLQHVACTLGYLSFLPIRKDYYVFCDLSVREKVLAQPCALSECDVSA